MCKVAVMCVVVSAVRAIVGAAAEDERPPPNSSAFQTIRDHRLLTSQYYHLNAEIRRLRRIAAHHELQLSNIKYAESKLRHKTAREVTPFNKTVLLLKHLVMLHDLQNLLHANQSLTHQQVMVLNKKELTLRTNIIRLHKAQQSPLKYLIGHHKEFCELHSYLGDFHANQTEVGPVPGLSDDTPSNYTQFHLELKQTNEEDIESIKEKIALHKQQIKLHLNQIVKIRREHLFHRRQAHQHRRQQLRGEERVRQIIRLINVDKSFQLLYRVLINRPRRKIPNNVASIELNLGSKNPIKQKIESLIAFYKNIIKDNENETRVLRKQLTAHRTQKAFHLTKGMAHALRMQRLFGNKTGGNVDRYIIPEEMNNRSMHHIEKIKQLFRNISMNALQNYTIPEELTDATNCSDIQRPQVMRNVVYIHDLAILKNETQLVDILSELYLRALLLNSRQEDLKQNHEAIVAEQKDIHSYLINCLRSLDLKSIYS